MITIVIPAYNEEHYLKACLDSIANQSTMPDEVIVVNNNSTDATAAVAARYPFVRVLDEPKQGIVYARNTGFDAAKSDIIGRIDADTILPRDWAARVLSFYATAANLTRGLTGGAYFYNARFGRLMGWWQGQIAFRMNRLLLGHYILYGSNMAVPKALWHKVKGAVCNDSDIHEDLDLAIHLHRAGFQITYHEPLKVGVYMRRVFSKRGDLWPNLLWWPKTLQRHGRWTWIFGWLGAAVLYGLSFLFLLFKKQD